MSGSRTYLLRVLQRLEQRLTEEDHYHAAGTVRRIADNLSSAENLQEALENLLRVEDLEQFAIGLMWMHARERGSSNGIQDEVVNHEVETLRRILLADPEDEEAPSSGTHPSGSLHTALVDFSRLVADMRRRLTGRTNGFNEEQVWRVQEQVSVLREAALSKRNGEVVRFCDAMTSFLDYVVLHRLSSDPRVLAIIDSANRTLQTVVAGGIPEERDSLEQTIELLKQSSTFFGE
jgi:hypothetical protein